MGHKVAYSLAHIYDSVPIAPRGRTGTWPLPRACPPPRHPPPHLHSRPHCRPDLEPHQTHTRTNVMIARALPLVSAVPCLGGSV